MGKILEILNGDDSCEELDIYPEVFLEGQLPGQILLQCTLGQTRGYHVLHAYTMWPRIF